MLTMPADEVAQLPDPTAALVALPQLVWAPIPSLLGPLRGNDAIWDYLMNPANNTYSLVPFTKPVNIPVYDRMSMQRFLTYPSNAASELPNFPPFTDPSNPYYPTLSGGRNYASSHNIEPDDACYGYSSLLEGFITTVGINEVVVPLSKSSDCYKEYADVQYILYLDVIFGANARLVAELGAFNYIDLPILELMLASATNFYDL